VAGQIVEIEADSVEEARQRAGAGAPHGHVVISEVVLDDGQPRSATGLAETSEGAAAEARSQVPPGGNIYAERALVAPNAWTATLPPGAEQDAVAQAQEMARQAGDGVVVRSLVPLPDPTGADHAGGWTAELFQPAIHEVAYVGKTRVRFELADSRDAAATPAAPTTPATPDTAPPADTPAAPAPADTAAMSAAADTPPTPAALVAAVAPDVTTPVSGPVSPPAQGEPPTPTAPGPAGFGPPAVAQYGPYGQVGTYGYTQAPGLATGAAPAGPPPFQPRPPRPRMLARIDAKPALRRALVGVVGVAAVAALVLDGVAFRNKTPSPSFRALSSTAVGLALLGAALVASVVVWVFQERSRGGTRSLVRPLSALAAVALVLAASGVLAARGPTCLQRTGAGADLRGCNLSKADLRGRDLSTADLSGVKLAGANLAGAKLGDAHLDHADLSGAKLGGADLAGANLSGAKLGGASLGKAKLGGADLGKADVTHADLSGADLARADLSGADLSDATLHNAVLDGATLSDTKFQRAALDHTSLNEVSLGGADVTDAKLTALGLDGATLVGITGASDDALASGLGVQPGELASTLNERDTPLEDPDTIRQALEPACLGQPVAGAGTSKPGATFHPMEMFGAQPPVGQRWDPPALRYAETVACVDDQTSSVVESCPYISVITGLPGPTVSRLQWAQHLRIINPATGAVIAEQTLQGPPPAPCPDTRQSTDPTEIGIQVAAGDVVNVLSPHVGTAPKS
jgi:Pentapeptide repeats (8 copies)